MRLTRRAAVAAGLGLVTGCLSTESNVSYPGSETPGSTPTPTPTPDRTPTATDTPAEPSVEHPRLARRTGRIDDELQWLVREYEPAVGAFREAARTAAETVATVADPDAAPTVLDAAAVDRVADAVQRVQSVVDERIEPHFSIGGFVADRTDRHVAVTRTFVDRGDRDRAREELRRLETLLRSFTRSTFVNEYLSRSPARNRLLQLLRLSSDPADAVLFELYDRGSEFHGYAYGGPSDRLSRDPMPDPLRSELDATFDPALVDDRTGATYVYARALPKPADQPEPLPVDRYPGTPVLVQRFPDVATAATAVDRLVGPDAPLQREAPGRLAGRRWQRVFYPAPPGGPTPTGGPETPDVLYAFLLRAGAFVLLLAPSPTAWTERVAWTDGVDRSWLWTPEGGR